MTNTAKHNYSADTNIRIPVAVGTSNVKEYTENVKINTIIGGNHRVWRKMNYQPNAITLSRQEFTYLERKIFIHCINQLDFELTSSHRNIKFLLAAKDLRTNYKRLKNVSQRITSRRIWSLNKAGFGVIVPFPEAEYFIGEDGIAYLGLSMYSNVVPLFLELKKSYTRFCFKTMLSLKSVYTQRLYEIIMMETHGKRRYSFEYKLEDLHYVLGSNYSNYADFCRRVLRPAKLELAEKANLLMEVVIVKKQRKRVMGLQFLIKSKVQDEAGVMEEDLKAWAKEDYTTYIESAHVLLEDYDFTSIQKKRILMNAKKLQTFMRLHSQLLNGDFGQILNPTAYMAQSLGFGK